MEPPSPSSDPPPVLASSTAPRVFNVNVGILGHVDSGKTSLARALSTLLSTAALDKHPQSAERGITLDLGFSAFQVDVPPSLVDRLPYDKVQFTLVDCPGHASLIRTIIGGAQIIDMMLLVVDVTKGIQTQTAECLVVGEVSPTKEMVVVLNKTDLLPAATKQAQIDKMRKRLRATLKGTKFADAAMVATAVAAVPSAAAAEGIADVINELMARVPSISRSTEGPFLFAIDHCFPIKGQGTVMTGTVLRGHVAVNDSLELPLLKLQKKVKSMQMFHKPVTRASQVCVLLYAAPGSVPMLSAAIAAVHPIRFFKGPLTSNSKFHVTVGHSTVMTTLTFFAHPFPHSSTALTLGASSAAFPLPPFPSPHHSNGQQQHQDVDSLCGFIFLSSLHPLLILPTNPLPVTYTNTCRMAFHGRILAPIDPTTMHSGSQPLRIYKVKSREGVIDRVVDSHSLIGRGLFKKETDISKFVGLRVSTVEGAQGTIQSPFGKSGKFKASSHESVVFQSTLPKEATGGVPVHITQGGHRWSASATSPLPFNSCLTHPSPLVLPPACLSSSLAQVVFQSTLHKEAVAGAPLHLVFKRLLFDKTKQMLQ
ncbi:unnamed protein product [Closterium sp. Naga37s-1]|nr:unnamed protein product [Closterium sp. Naga37s-1]